MKKTKEKVEINSTTYNVFSNFTFKGEDPTIYFTANKPNNQYDNSANEANLINRIFYFGYGHWQGNGTYTATFKLTFSNLQLNTVNKVKVDFNLHLFFI